MYSECSRCPKTGPEGEDSVDSVRLWFRQAPTCHGVSEWPGGSGGGCVCRERGDWRVFLLGLRFVGAIRVRAYRPSGATRRHTRPQLGIRSAGSLLSRTRRRGYGSMDAPKPPTQVVAVMKLAAALLLSCCGQRQSPPTPAPHVARNRPGVPASPNLRTEDPATAMSAPILPRESPRGLPLQRPRHGIGDGGSHRNHRGTKYAAAKRCCDLRRRKKTATPVC